MMRNPPPIKINLLGKCQNFSNFPFIIVYKLFGGQFGNEIIKLYQNVNNS